IGSLNARSPAYQPGSECQESIGLLWARLRDEPDAADAFAGCLAGGGVGGVGVERLALVGNLHRAIVAGDEGELSRGALYFGRIRAGVEERRPRSRAGIRAVAHTFFVVREDVEHEAFAIGEDSTVFANVFHLDEGVARLAG